MKPAKPGEVRNPTGKNGKDWMAHARGFWEKTEANINTTEGGKVQRIDNVLSSIHRSAMLGGFNQQEFVARVMGINPATRTELTGADGQPLTPTLPVLIRLPSANTLEDDEPDSGGVQDGVPPASEPSGADE